MRKEIKIVQYTGRNKKEIENYLDDVKVKMYKEDSTAFIEAKGDAVLVYPGEYIMQKGEEMMVCPEEIYEFIYPKKP